MNLNGILAASKDFYRAHKLEAWAKALPQSIKLNKEAEAALGRAKKLGLTQVLVFPDFRTQMTSITTVIAETALAPVPGIPVDPRFAKTYISDNWAKEPTGRVYQTSNGLVSREQGPYLLFYNLQLLPKQTVGKKGNQIAKIFKDENWDGFTSPELLIAQRFLARTCNSTNRCSFLQRIGEILLGVGGRFRRQRKLLRRVLWLAGRGHVRMQSRQRQQTARRECDDRDTPVVGSIQSDNSHRKSAFHQRRENP